MKWHGSVLALMLTLLSTPFAAHAAFSFTEIMYDATGTDTKHEWIEVLNSGAPADLSSYKLFENGTNHGLTLQSGSATVPTNGYAIIADDAATFLTDFPSFSGTLFDSAFSLSNTGETFSLRDADAVDVASATYNAEGGAAGDGNSLQWMNGVWTAALSTPGAGISSGGGSGSGASTSTVQTSGSTSGQGSGVALPFIPSITADAGTDRVVVAGAGTVFTARAFGTKSEPLANATYTWNFGNGASAVGQRVMYAYTIPGTYTVFVDVASGGHATTARFTAKVIPADIVVVRAGSEFIELENRTEHEIDIGLWQMSVLNQVFVIPTHTLLASGAIVAFPSTVTRLLPERATDVRLYYPNGEIAGGAAPEITFKTGGTPQNSATPSAAVSSASGRVDAPLAVFGEKFRTPPDAQVPVLTASMADAVPQENSAWAWASATALTLMVLVGAGGIFLLNRA